MNRAELRKRWAEDRRSLAEGWFGGDEEAATEFLHALPYSAIPDWSDAQYVLETFETLQLRKNQGESSE